ncbi:MAG: lysozyme inhibitor LprI family protein [Candidatus Sumerlaeaceae bacterium]
MKDIKRTSAFVALFTFHCTHCLAQFGRVAANTGETSSIQIAKQSKPLNYYRKHEPVPGSIENVPGEFQEHLPEWRTSSRTRVEERALGKLRDGRLAVVFDYEYNERIPDMSDEVRRSNIIVLEATPKSQVFGVMYAVGNGQTDPPLYVDVQPIASSGSDDLMLIAYVEKASGHCKVYEGIFFRGRQCKWAYFGSPDGLVHNIREKELATLGLEWWTKCITIYPDPWLCVGPVRRTSTREHSSVSAKVSFSGYRLRIRKWKEETETEAEQRRLAREDRELNNVYGYLLRNLSTAEQKSLIEEQRAWIKERDQRCKKSESRDMSGPTGCLADETSARTNELKEKLRAAVHSARGITKEGELVPQ